MFRATGYRRPLLPWDRGRSLRPGGAAFAQRPFRLAAATAVAGLLLANALLVYQLTGEDAATLRQGATSATGLQLNASDLRSALETLQAEIREDVGRLTVRYQETSDRRGRSQESRFGEGARAGSRRDDDGTVSTSTTPASGGSSSASSSTETDTGVGSGGSGGSSGGDTSTDSSSGSSSGSSGGSGTGGTGGVTSGGGGAGGGGAGGGGTGDGGTGGDVSGGGGGGG